MSSSGSADEESTSSLQISRQARLALASQVKIIPEGGWGWAICAAAFVTQLIVMGIHNSFGILYTTLLEEYKRSKAETAWVGSVSVGVMYLFGPITSGLTERLGCRVVALLGGLLCFLGMLLTSFVSDLKKLYVTYGVLWGIGTSFCYFPTLTAPGEYFCKRLSLVNGIVTAGSGIGTLTFGPVLQYILQRYGLASSLRILSGVSLLLLLAALTYKPFRSPLEELFEVKRQPGPFFDLSIWQNRAFCVYTVAVAVFMLGYFIPYVHLVSHVEGLGISPSKAVLLIGFMSIASTISRFGFGKFSDHPRVNRLFMTQVAILGFGVTTTLSPLARSYSSLVTVVVALGLFDGLYVVLIAVVNTDIVGVHKLSAALGSLYGVISFTLALGPPFAGLMYDMLHSYHTAFYICGATTTLSSCLMFLIPWLMPDQQGGVFRRDSCHSRIESLLSSQPSTPRSRIHSRRFFAEGHAKVSSTESGGSSTSSHATGEISLCEADRIDGDFLTGFATNDDGSLKADEAAAYEMTSFSVDTSINTVFNSTMSHRGSITKFLLQQQLQSHSRASTPTSGSRRGSGQGPLGIQSGGSSTRSSLSSSLGGYNRTSSSTPTKGKGSFKSSRSESRRGSTDISEESNSEESHVESSSEPEAEIEALPLGQVFCDGSRRESGDSTVVASRWESGQSTAITGTPRMSREGDGAPFRTGMKDTDLLHVLAARLLQAARGREEDECGEEKETVV